METQEKVRKQVWVRLRDVARPDSRFHWDFNKFIPDFAGSELCLERVTNSVPYRDAQTLLVTPDNSLAGLRARCLVDGKALIVPSYGLGRGFLFLEAANVPAGQETLAATLDGLDYYARPYPVIEDGGQPLPDLLVTGASVLNRAGVRISRGPSYFDLEWLLLAHLNLITTQTPIITVVHDCQLVDLPYAPTPHSTVTDLIVTPSTTINAAGSYPRPTPSAWDQLPWEVIQNVPFLEELRAGSGAGPRQPS